MMALILLMLLFGVAHSAPTTAPNEPRKCCLDKQFTAALADIGAAGANMDSLYFIDGTTGLAFDYYQQKARSYTRMENADGSAYIRDELKDYTNRVVYTTDEHGNCTVGPLQPYDLMFDGCVPDDATYLGAQVFGFGMYSLPVYTWAFMLPGNGTDRWQAVMSVTRQHCVPVIETLSGMLNGAPIEESLFYTAYTPRIDADVSFVPPPNCKMAASNAPIVGR